MLQWDCINSYILFHFTETALNKTCKYPKVLRLVNNENTDLLLKLIYIKSQSISFSM